MHNFANCKDHIKTDIEKASFFMIGRYMKDKTSRSSDDKTKLFFIEKK